MNERLHLRLDGDPLHAPGSSVPAGTMTDLAVLRGLAEHVAHVTIYRETIEGLAFERVVPDGAVRLLFDLGPHGGRAHVAGPSASPLCLRLAGPLANLTVTLRPGAASELLGIPVAALQGQCVALDGLWPEANSLSEQLLGAEGDAERGAIVQSALVTRLTKARAWSRARADRARQALAAGHTVRAAAEAVGVGERRLEQIFQEAVGLSPRQYRRLARVQTCLRALRTPARPRWSELALEHGFSDQAHLSNELAAVVGLTPTEIHRRISGSFKTSR